MTEPCVSVDSQLEQEDMMLNVRTVLLLISFSLLAGSVWALECDTDAECSGKLVCVFGECICMDDSHCPAGQTCDFDSGECREPGECQVPDTETTRSR